MMNDFTAVKLVVWHFWTESEIRCFDHEKKKKKKHGTGKSCPGRLYFALVPVVWSRVVSALSRFGPGSFRPGSFRPNLVGRFGLIFSKSPWER